MYNISLKYKLNLSLKHVMRALQAFVVSDLIIMERHVTGVLR